MTIRPTIASVLLMLFTAVGVAPAVAQSGSGAAAIEGIVADPDTRAVVTALVIIVSNETGYERAVFTDAHGRYFATAMPVGSYEVDVSARGFARVQQGAVRLTIGATTTVNFSLKVANVAETITVTATVPRLDKDDTATSTVVGAMAVANLPIRGRDFTEFAQLTPAVTQETDRNGLVIAGQRSINSNIAIDGTDFNDALQGNQRGGNEGVFFFPQAAIREFQVIRSGANAEVGRTNSGFVNVVTKSGTNDIHGETFYYDREKALTSPDAFDRSLNNQQNQMGGSIGGPLVRDRAFFFGAAEQSLLKIPYVVHFDAQLPGVAVPASLLAQEGEQRATNNPTAIFGRTDAVVGGGLLNIQGTYTHLRGQNFNFDSLQINQAVTTNFNRTSESVGLKGGLTSIFGAELLNDLRGQVATDNREELPNVRSANITITGFGSLGGDSGRPRAFDTTRYEVTDNLTKTAGAHRVRVGFDVNVNDAAQQREDNIQGRYDYKSLSDFVAGKISRYRQTVLVFNPEDALFTGRQREVAGYVQDKMSLGDHVTASAGLRWEGQWNPQPTKPNPAIPSTAFIPNDLKQWQPRAGIAWDASGSGTTVVRVSAGMYIARTPATLFQRVFTDNGITTVVVDSKFDPAVLTQLTYPNALTGVPAGLRIAAPRVFGFDPEFRNPRSLQASATVEQLLGDDVSVSVSYLHNSTNSLQRRLDRNLFAPTPDATTGMPIFPATRPNPKVGAISINESTAKSRYDALAVTLTRRMAQHVQMQTNYAWALNMDDDSNEHLFRRETALNPFDLAAEWSYAKNDVRHNLNFNALAELPGGFMTGAILFARTGTPYTPIIGFDTQNDANDENDRAIVDGQVVGRNMFRQPAFFDLDLRLMKGFRFGAAREIELIAEMFNVTRARNLSFGPDGVSPSGTPAQPVATAGLPLFAPSTARFGGPRQVQLGLRLVF